MELSELQCYYKDCRKHFQSKVFLITHINSCHLDAGIYKCPCCNTYFTSLEIYLSHYKNCKLNDSIQLNGSFILSSQFNCENNQYFPPNLLKLPVLPLIEKERSDCAYRYKLPMTAKLFDFLSTD
ncbi:hypothetical protein SteCoe_5571 [Stentor coeruleus]|uniref:C2H2-type domain-containing protein n=1 Tax=Stentor coeruleus TaxID=5963 RepID=A0A1R2CS33_9CILI|nr:hypothetical protein SteCoe_5571 [Stentor coeruleus]